MGDSQVGHLNSFLLTKNYSMTFVCVTDLERSNNGRSV